MLFPFSSASSLSRALARLGLAMLACAGASAAYAGGFSFPGDGSGADTPDLLSATPIGTPLSAPPPEPLDLPVGLDWSMGLRGAYVQDAYGKRFETDLLPSVTLAQKDSRAALSVNANGDFAKTGSDPMRIGALRLGFDGSYNVDRLTSVTGGAIFSLSQDSPDVPGTPSNVTEAPLVGSGSADIGVTRKISRFDVSLRGNVERDVYGPTTFDDGTQQTHVDENRWLAGVGLRVSHPITPIVSGFTDLSASRDAFDAASPTLSVKLDGADYALRAGFSGAWDSVLEAEASVGLGLRRFNDPSVPDISATLYDASVTYRPNATLTLTGAFSTSIQPTGVNASGSAEVEYAAVGGIAYQINQWLGVRASAGWHNAEIADSGGATDKGYGLGVGSDYAINGHTRLSLDYAFTHSEVTPSPPQDSHVVTVGVTVAR